MNPIAPLLMLGSGLSTFWLWMKAQQPSTAAGKTKVEQAVQKAASDANEALAAKERAAAAAREALAAEQARQAQADAKQQAAERAAAAERQRIESEKAAAAAAQAKADAQARADSAAAQQAAEQEAREKQAAEQARAEAAKQAAAALAAADAEQAAAAAKAEQAKEAARQAAVAEQARLAAAEALARAQREAAAAQPVPEHPVVPQTTPAPAPATPPLPPPGSSWQDKLRTGAVALQNFLAANQSPQTAPTAYGWKDHPSSQVQLFQRLANSLIAAGAPGPQLAEDGIFGPQTAARAAAVAVILSPRPPAQSAVLPVAAAPAAAAPPLAAAPQGYDPILAKTLAAQVEADLRASIQKNKRYDYNRDLMKRFQIAAGLTPDGIYGGGTRGAMLYYGRTRAPSPLFKPTNTIPYTPPVAA